MKLLTQELLTKFKKVGRDESTEVGDKLVVAKFFDPTGAATWYATEYDPVNRTFFGFAQIHAGMGEWRYFSLDELESFRGRYGLGIERDAHFDPTLFRNLSR